MTKSRLTKINPDHGSKILVGLLKVDAVKSDSTWTQSQRTAFTKFIAEKLDLCDLHLSKKHMGDGFLLTMTSIEEVASFALKLLVEIPAIKWPDSETNGPPEIRCALHLAEVEIIKTASGVNEITGDGVNHVSRIEPIADSGVLTCTEEAKLVLCNKANRFSFEDLGIRTLQKGSGEANLYKVGFSSGKKTISKPLSKNVGQTVNRDAAQGVATCTLSSENIRSIMCFHQGKVLEFFFLTARRHKALRLAIEAKGRGRKEKIKDAEKQLREYIITELETVYSASFKPINDCYFGNRKATLPRICVKGYFDLHTRTPAIEPIARNSKVAYENKTTKNNNTGFFEVETSQKPYLCNDILKDVVASKYKHNPRLNIKQILTDTSLMGEEKVRERWSAYWDKGKADPKTCYQSTLIVPMTLINNSLSHEFKKEFGLDGFEKIIFGFLCFDHTEKDYFTQDDQNIGYVLADIFSLYQVAALGFTSASKSYGKAVNT